MIHALTQAIMLFSALYMSLHFVNLTLAVFVGNENTSGEPIEGPDKADAILTCVFWSVFYLLTQIGGG